MAFQFSDAPPGPAAEGPSATDRLPPGKGVIDWKGVFGLLNGEGVWRLHHVRSAESGTMEAAGGGSCPRRHQCDTQAHREPLLNRE